MKINSMTQELYDQDYQQWLEETVEILRDRSFDLWDIENLIEEISAMGRNQKDSLESKLTVLLMHLLKYQYQPEKKQESNSWRYTIVEQNPDYL